MMPFILPNRITHGVTFTSCFNYSDVTIARLQVSQSPPCRSSGFLSCSRRGLCSSDPDADSTPYLDLFLEPTCDFNISMHYSYTHWIAQV
ncbi:unnamed protein product [Protopolystoma xenopodis]|uniref:Uncharacterized protein n=1 Tax=Protopolystoma xenopodis TaxID=117903 RepID=A0A3S5C1X6_9PLAT|nr:unnamed protein product [Protopolystoma xenopodis]